MQCKVNLHAHTAEDPKHPGIAYSTRELIDRAAANGFGALAITPHNCFTWNMEDAAYARERGIVLLPGIELSLRSRRWYPQKGKHVVVLDCDPDVENIRTFAELREYKRAHPEVFILAAHPFMYGFQAMKRYFWKYADIFDAVEYSWFHAKHFNRNIRAQKAGQKLDMPVIATSDTHLLDHFYTDYARVEVSELTPEAVFEAIRTRRFTNYSEPKRLFGDMAHSVIKMKKRDLVAQFRNMRAKTSRCFM